MEAKQAVRDVGRALGMSPKDTDTISKLIPFGTGLADALTTVEQLKTMYNDGTKLSGITVRELFDTAMKLEVNRNFSTQRASSLPTGSLPTIFRCSVTRMATSSRSGTRTSSRLSAC